MKANLNRCLAKVNQGQIIVTENEFEKAFTDTVAENDGFVAPNYDYVTTLAPIKTVEDMDGDNFFRKLHKIVNSLIKKQ